MDHRFSALSRRDALTRLGAAGAALALGPHVAHAEEGPHAGLAAPGDWDTAWLERVRRAKHRALFDSPQSMELGPMLAARFLDGVRDVFAASGPDAIAVINARTMASALGLSDATWKTYRISEDLKMKDASGEPYRKNPGWAPAPNAIPAMQDIALERLVARGAIVLVCDFALGHLATRLSKGADMPAGTTAASVHAALRAGLVPGGFLVPSGIFGLGAAQNAGCAFVPA